MVDFIKLCLHITFLFCRADFGLLKGTDGWLSSHVKIFSSRSESSNHRRFSALNLTYHNTEQTQHFETLKQLFGPKLRLMTSNFLPVCPRFGFYLRGHLLYPVTSSQVVWRSVLSFSEYLNSHLPSFIIHQPTRNQAKNCRVSVRPLIAGGWMSSARGLMHEAVPTVQVPVQVCAGAGLVF